MVQPIEAAILRGQGGQGSTTVAGENACKVPQSELIEIDGFPSEIPAILRPDDLYSIAKFYLGRMIHSGNKLIISSFKYDPNGKIIGFYALEIADYPYTLTRKVKPGSQVALYFVKCQVE